MRWILIALGLLSLWPLASLGRFMLDASALEHARAPHVRSFDDPELEKPFFPKHSCFSSYAVAQQLALDGEPNLYQPELYRNPEQKTLVHSEIGDWLNVDSYQYPPPFLLLPWGLMRLGGGFYGARALFYLLNLVSFAVCLYAAQRWLQRGMPACGRSALVWAAWPLVLLAGTTLTTLQIGNVHAFVMVLSILGMLAAVQSRPWIAGALLGFVTLGKIFPALLLVYLLARGKFRVVLWSMGFGLAYALFTLLLFGAQPFQAFLGYQLGRIASAEAFEFAFRIPRAMLVNSSFMGIPYRLQGLGILESGQLLGQILSWTAGLLVLGYAWVAGRSRRDASALRSERGRYAELALWLALLVLAQMRSPFLPAGYGSFVVLWLLAILLVAPGGSLRWRARIMLLLPVWYVLSSNLPLAFGPRTLQLDFAFALLGTTLALCLVVAAGRRAARSQMLSHS